MIVNRHILIHRERVCGHKQGFLTERGAREDAKIVHPDKRMDAYECRYCGLWHYGKNRKEQANGQAKPGTRTHGP